jgi:hypothetical protein
MTQVLSLGRMKPVRSIANYVKREWQELLVLLLLGVFLTWIRLRTLEPIELGGDAVQKWFFVRRWAYPHPLEGTDWNHHFTRMGDNVPVFILQRLFGTSPPVYYFAPLLSFMGTGFAVYAIGKHAKSRFTGVLAAVFFALFAPMKRAASQLLPAIFSCLYVTAGAYCLLRYTRAEPGQRPRWAVLSALGIFAAYLSHETNVFFVPGFAVVLWLHGKNVRHLALFCGVLLGAFLLETAAYAAFTPYWGRLHITMLTHGDTPGLKVASTWGLLGRFASSDFGPAFQRYFFSWPFAAVGVALLARERFARLVALLPFSFLFLATFLVRGLDPIRTWMSYQSRYLIPAVPLMVLSHALFVVCCAELVCRAFVRVAPLLEGRAPRAARLWRLPLLARWELPCIALLLLGLCYAHYPSSGLRVWWEGHPLVSWHATADVIRDTYRRHLPIIGDKKAVMLAHRVYIDDALLLENGQLPMHSPKMLQLNRADWLLSSDPPAYAQDARSKRKGKAGGKRCLLELRARQRFLRAPPPALLPETCEAQASSLVSGTD